MPDLDIVNPVAPGWHRPYKLVLGGAEPAEVGRAALKALSGSLRRGHGLPSLDKLTRVACTAIGGGFSARDALDRLHAIERASGGDRHTKVGVRAVMGIIAEMGDEPVSAGISSELIASHFCKDLLAHHLHGPAWTEVLGERFSVQAEARAFDDACASAVEPGLTQLGRSLARNPEATDLRAPVTRQARKRSTAELLEETIVARER